MKAPLILLALVGLTLASSQPGWKEKTEYVYLVSGRTLTSLHELADQYAGIFFKAKMHVSLCPDGKLQAWISDAQYAQIHSQLSDGWNTYVPETQLSYKQMELSNKPFRIITKNGVIRGLIVEKEIANWEANMIKSIVSQFQVDVRGKNIMHSPINNLPANDKLEGVFKTMEETITGETETAYDIHRFPKYLILSEPWLVPQYQLIGDGDIYEVIKTKNYTNAKEMPAYHYGFGEIAQGEPTSNRLGEFFTRESSSRIILTGKVSKYTIQYSQTINKLLFKPVLNTKKYGSVISTLNITLSDVKSETQQPRELSNPVEIGNLVYTYESSFADSNKVRQKLQSDRWRFDSSEESTEKYWTKFRRSARSTKTKLQQNDGDSSSSEEMVQHQTTPIMSEAPESPLLPYYVGHQGRSIKTNGDFDLKQNVQRLAKEISEDLGQPENILTQSTLSKYTILSSLIRLMNQDEITSVSEQLYNQAKQGEKRLTWVVFRDAVTEAGTGPAFLNIEQWISTKKIEEGEAAEVVASMAHAVRTPTQDYMQKFFELVKKPEVRYQAYLNETALLAYTHLLNRVWVNKHQSHNQYPAYSFKTFSTKEGKEFVKTVVIPYLSQQLHDAAAQADSRKIHVYIRALGNVGESKILEAFEPYLEGQKQISQFQRMFIVLCLDKLVNTYPVVARSVLYRIYQNTGEIPEVRTVAVYQLMRTNPPFEMLQRMAENTNNDPQEEVNAVVKSAIENASQLKSSGSQSLRKAAEAAKPLLTKKQYGHRQSWNLLKDFTIKNIDGEFKQNLLNLGSSDSNLPKGIKYTMRTNIGGLKQYFFNIQATLSSIKELTNVLYMQTEKYQQTKYRRAQHSEENNWSAVKIAEMLNIETNEREQLEGFIYAEVQSLQKIWSFDNGTIQQLPQAIRELEQILKDGKQVNYTKFKQLRERALSLPTEMGLPFLYIYDYPILLQFGGDIRATATPAVSRQDKLYTPAQVSGEIDGFLTITTKGQSQLSVVTPFDHQIYVAGLDKNVQVHLPLKVKVEIDVTKYQTTVECELNENHKDARLFHYSSWPYTSKSDLMSISPVALRPNTHRIRQPSNSHNWFDFVLGKKQTGMSFRVWGHQPRQSYSILQNVIKSSWDNNWDDTALQNTEVSIRLAPEQSTTTKVVSKLAFRSLYNAQPQMDKQEEFLTMDQILSRIQSNTQNRQQELLEHVNAGINSAWATSIDASVKFEGERKYHHLLTLAFAKSNVAPESHLIALYKNNAEEPLELSLQAKGYIPNSNELDITHSLINEPKAKYEVFIEHRKRQQSSKVRATVDMSRCPSRTKYLEEQPLYHVCKREMQEGNYQLHACQNMTIESNYLNDINIEIEYENMESRSELAIKDIFHEILTHYPMIEVKNIHSEPQNKIHLRVHFEPEHLQQFNISVRKNSKKIEIFNISSSELGKTILVPHQAFNLKARLVGKFTGQDNIRPTCVIDETAAQTFSNKTYPLSLHDGWTLMMQYIPQQARLTEERRLGPIQQLKEQQENFVVLVREVSEHHKELKLTFDHPTTEGKTVELYLRQKQGTISVLVDGQEVHFNDNNAADLFQGFVETYSLPNGEVKVEIKDWFHVVFDGKRVKVTAVSDKLRDSIVGLCGRFNDDKYEDFWTPYNCIVSSPSKFVESFKLENRQSRRPQECFRKELPLYVDVISSNDVERKPSFKRQNSNSISVRNRYVEQNNDICFTIRPVPDCKTNSRKTKTENVPVHCIAKSKIADYLKNQIDQGGNPDFSHKPVSRTITMEIPEDCY